MLGFKRMDAPSLEHLPDELRSAATGIARRLRSGGFQGWLVGGAVRDLALGRNPKDVDIATDARPEDVERLFPGAKDVGRAFGTMIVVEAGLAAQVTTFRSERGYSDARRPDHVQFGASVDEDARRRDFTCNALFLDPLDGTCLDPVGGLADLRARRLRAVGEPRERFREDGLRLLRLARFAADLDLEVDPATLAGAREAAGSIVGVSGERVLAELATMAQRARAAKALELLDGLGLLARVLPDVPAAEFGRRCAVARELADPLGEVALLAVLVLDEALDGARATPRDRLEARIGPFHPSRELLQSLREVAELLGELARWPFEAPRRSQLVRAARRAAFATAARIARASLRARQLDASALEAELTRAKALSEAELRPRPLLSSADFAEAGIPRGPRWGELLLAAETAQLELEFTTREAALDWLRARRST